MPESRRVHDNTARDLLEVAEAMLNGEIDDALPYDDPRGRTA